MYRPHSQPHAEFPKTLVQRGCGAARTPSQAPGENAVATKSPHRPRFLNLEAPPTKFAFSTSRDAPAQKAEHQWSVAPTASVLNVLCVLLFCRECQHNLRNTCIHQLLRKSLNSGRSKRSIALPTKSRSGALKPLSKQHGLAENHSAHTDSLTSASAEGSARIANRHGHAAISPR